MRVNADVSRAMDETTPTVEVRPTRVWLLKLRVLLGCLLLRAAAKVMGVGEIRFDHVER